MKKYKKGTRKRQPRPTVTKIVAFYDAWRAHVDAGFEVSRGAVEKVASLCGVEAPAFADKQESEREELYKAVGAIAGTPVGQQVLERVLKFVDASSGASPAATPGSGGVA